jgi:hypothetical protein
MVALLHLDSSEIAMHGNSNRILLSFAILLIVFSPAARISAQTLPLAPTTITYTIQFAGNGSARVTSTPKGLDCPGVCTYTWPAVAPGRRRM